MSAIFRRMRNSYRPLYSAGELVAASVDGDERARMQLYQAHAQPVYNAIYRMLRNRQEAEDLTHDTFLEAFNRLEELQNPEALGGWLKKIGIRKALNGFKRQQLYWEFERTEKLEASEPDFGFIEEENPAHQLKIVQEAIGRLPDGYRVVLSLHLLEGYDHEEISQILGITASTSRSQYSRALKNLQNELKSVSHE